MEEDEEEEEGERRRRHNGKNKMFRKKDKMNIENNQIIVLKMKDSEIKDQTSESNVKDMQNTNRKTKETKKKKILFFLMNEEKKELKRRITLTAKHIHNVVDLPF